MRYYIATRLENHVQHNLVRDRLHAAGHQITYDWTVHGPVWRDGAERIQAVEAAERQGIHDADVVIVLLPGGRGTHVELGMALAWGKPVLMWTDDARMAGATPETCAFYHNPQVAWVFNSDLLGLIVSAVANVRVQPPASAMPSDLPARRGGHPRFHDLLEEMRRVHDAKNSDYAAKSNALSNFYECERAGISAVDGCFTRLSDKYCRCANLMKKARAGDCPAVKDESLQDTLVDLANYALLMVILMEERADRHVRAQPPGDEIRDPR